MPVPVYGVAGDELARADAKAPQDDGGPPSRQATSTNLVATDGLPFAASMPTPPPPSPGNGWSDRDSAPASPPALPFQRKSQATRPIETLPGPSATPFETRQALSSTGGHAAAPPLAEVSLVPPLYRPRRFAVDVARFPRLLAVEARCAALDAFAAAHPDRQPDATPS